MKKNNYTNGLFAVLLLASPLVGADTKYPAADFKPEVVFQDEDYIAKNSKQSEEASSSSKKSEKTSVDSKYPAANFEPQVVYSDENYKPSKGSDDVAPVAQKTLQGNNETQAPASDATVEKTESSPNYFVGLIALGAIGFFLLRNQNKGSAKEQVKASINTVRNASGLTGVSRYLNKTTGTGVSRYLEKQVKSAASVTGVAKYMAKKSVSGKTTAGDVSAATGVEKYMRKRS